MGWKDEARQRFKDAAQGNKYDLAPGQNTFRLLCAKEALEMMATLKKTYRDLPDKPKPYRDYLVHYNVGPKRQGVQNIQTCGHDIYGGGTCWLCDALLPSLLRSNSDAKRAQAQAMVAKARMTVMVSPIDRETGSFGAPKPLSMDRGGGKSLYIKILSLLKEPKRDYEDPQRGYNVTIERLGTGTATTWMSPDPDERPTKVPDSVLSQIKPLEGYPYSEKEQKAAYHGQETTDTVDDESEVEPDPDPGLEELMDESDTGDYSDEEEGAFDDEDPVEEDGEEFGTDSEDEDSVGDQPEDEPEPEPAPPPRRSTPLPVRKQAPPPVRPANRPVATPPHKKQVAPVKQAVRRK